MTESKGCNCVTLESDKWKYRSTIVVVRNEMVHIHCSGCGRHIKTKKPGKSSNFF